MNTSNINKFIYTINCFAQSLESYKQHITQDNGLESSSIPKMLSLIEDFIMRGNELVIAAEAMRISVERIEKGMAIASADNVRKYKTLEDEYKNLYKLFDKLSITTPKLLDMKRQVDTKIELYEATHKTRSKSVDKPVDKSDKWLESLAEEVMIRNVKIRELANSQASSNLMASSMNSCTRIALTKDIPTYLTGFKIVQEELGYLKEQMKTLNEMQEKQISINLHEAVHKLLAKTERVAADNTQIKEDHAELLHSLHIISKSI